MVLVVSPQYYDMIFRRGGCFSYRRVSGPKYQGCDYVGESCKNASPPKTHLRYEETCPDQVSTCPLQVCSANKLNMASTILQRGTSFLLVIGAVIFVFLTTRVPTSSHDNLNLNVVVGHGKDLHSAKIPVSFGQRVIFHSFNSTKAIDFGATSFLYERITSWYVHLCFPLA